MASSRHVLPSNHDGATLIPVSNKSGMEGRKDQRDVIVSVRAEDCARVLLYFATSRAESS